MATIGRFVVPADDRRSRSYVRSHLHAPHGVRQRIRHELWLPQSAAIPPSEPALTNSDIRTLLDEARIPSERVSTVIEERDYEHSARHRTLLFLFTDDDSPRFVIKVRPHDDAAGLRREYDVLCRLQRALPPSVRVRLPDPIALRTFHGFDALLTSALDGRSAYVDMHQGARSERAVRRHFDAAVEFLIAFQNARPWGVHGDFWARNLLLRDGDAAMVVDWEHYQERGHPADDLFHFALTYALNYPWRWRGVTSPDEAFERAFIRDTPMSHAIGAAFATYASAIGLDRGELRWSFLQFLRRHPSAQGGTRPWLHMMVKGDRCVFSG